MRAYPAFLFAIVLGLLSSPAAADGFTCGPRIPCPAGYTCTNGQCVSQGGSGGGSATQVEQEPVCTALALFCTTSAQCPLGYACVNGSCVRPIDPGGSATQVEEEPTCSVTQSAS